MAQALVWAQWGYNVEERGAEQHNGHARQTPHFKWILRWGAILVWQGLASKRAVVHLSALRLLQEKETSEKSIEVVDVARCIATSSE